MYSTSIIGSMHIRRGKGSGKENGLGSDERKNGKENSKKCDKIIDTSEVRIKTKESQRRITNGTGSGRKKITTARTKHQS